MIHITVCDDDPEMIRACREFARRFDSGHPYRLSWHFLEKPEEMEAQALAQEDILILDIQMGRWNGIDLARQIRRFNEQCIIIFSTNYLEYALQGYEVEAFRYLKKPILYEQLEKVLCEAAERHLRSEQASLVLRCGYDTEQVRIADILYCETEAGHVRISLRGGRSIMANTAMGSLEEELKDHGFFRCHKGCLVCLSQVQQPLKNEVLMKDGRRIPVSRHRMKEFMLALMKHWGGQLL